MGKILLITASLRVGGAEKVARDIGLASRNNGYEVDYLVFGSTAGEYEDAVTGAGCRTIRVPSPSEGYGRYFRTLKRLMRENRYDVVHAHTMFNAGWAMLAAKQEGVPVRIAHAHSALNDGKSIKKQLYESVMRRLILNHATELVACGDAAGIRLFGREAYEARGKRILNGIDVDAFAFDAEARRRIREQYRLEDAFVIGHVGHLAAVKNQSFLIRLMPEIMSRRVDARLLLLGEGSDRPMLEQLIRDLRLTERVVMTGNVGNVPDYLSAMDVFAFPSLYEGMPLSILEVQANGLPCVLSTGVPKDVYLTDLIRPLSLDDPAAWAEAVCGAERKNPERYNMELKAGGFDSASMAEKIINLYERAERH